MSTNLPGAAGLPSPYWAVGLETSGLEHCPGIGLAHPAAAAALQRLQSRARRAGMVLEVASGYRDYSRQLAIFNAKFQGHRPVYSDAGEQLYRSQFDDAAWLKAILHYSALPGTSRHHWGTDFDVWDSSAVAGDYQLQLQASEYTGDGPFAALSDWLAGLIARDDAEGQHGQAVQAQDDTGVVAGLQHRFVFALFEVHVPDDPQVVVGADDRSQHHQYSESGVPGAEYGIDDVQLAKEADERRHAGHAEHQEHHH